MIIPKNTKNIVNAVVKYDDMLYDSRPVKFSEFISNKYNVVHRKLYKYALNKYIEYYIKNNINSVFLYELFNALNDCNRIEDVYEFIKTSDLAKDIQKSFDALMIDDELYIKDIIEIILEKITQLKADIYSLNISGITKLCDITDFILSYKESTYLFEEIGENTSKYKLIEGSIFASENESSENMEYNIEEDYLIILEDDEYGKVHIGYNKDGKWYLKIDSTIDITNIKDQLNDLMNTTNKTLTDNIREVCKNYFINSHKIIEIKNSEYWQPSTIVIIGKRRPYRKTNIDLTPWWNYYQSKQDKNIKDIKITKEVLQDSELVFLDYVKGIAYMRTKLDGIEYTVDFDFLDENINISDEYSLKDTFTSKIINVNN